METLKYLIIFLLVAIISSCRGDYLFEDSDTENEETVDRSEYSDWTETTHGNETAPNYSVVFNQNKVLRIDIKMSNKNWQTMQTDLSLNLSSGGRPGFGGAPEIQNSDYTPVWVECSVIFEGKEWYHVGVRYKGNSSLMSTYRSGIKKLSFKLDFDQFEDEYPSLKNQRFYGFKQLNLKNNFEDESLVREKVAGDLFREFGLAASQVSFCAVYVDNGEGPLYFGLYSLVEEVDDTVLGTQFSDESGNLYKPDGTAATFANGTFNTSQMEKKNNEELADFSDVRNLYNAINSSGRTSNREEWKTELESAFDVDAFLKWLAANTAIQNWDTYGKMTHNYYLYNNPENNKLTWIPWDNNEALAEGKQGGALSLALNEVDENWPLIRYIIDDPVYSEKYNNHLNNFVNNVFESEKMHSMYNNYYNLLKDYAYSEVSGYTFIKSNASFDNAFEVLRIHATERKLAVEQYLAK